MVVVTGGLAPGPEVVHSNGDAEVQSSRRGPGVQERERERDMSTI